MSDLTARQKNLASAAPSLHFSARAYLDTRGSSNCGSKMVARGGILAAALLLCAATVDAKALLQFQVPVGYLVCPGWHSTSAVACTWLLSSDSQPTSAPGAAAASTVAAAAGVTDENKWINAAWMHQCICFKKKCICQSGWCAHQHCQLMFPIARGPEPLAYSAYSAYSAGSTPMNPLTPACLLLHCTAGCS